MGLEQCIKLLEKMRIVSMAIMIRSVSEIPFIFLGKNQPRYVGDLCAIILLGIWGKSVARVLFVEVYSLMCLTVMILGI